MPFALKLFDYEQPIMRFKATSEGEYVEQLYNTIPVYYTGRIDLPVMWDNQLVVIDHKTTSAMGDYFFKDQRVNPQMIGYCYAFQKLTGRTVNGFCINAIRSRPQHAKPVGGMDRWWDENSFRQKEF